MKTIRVEVQLSDEDLAAFLHYHQLVYGEKPKDVRKALRRRLGDAIDATVNDWHVQMEENPIGEDD